MQVQPILGHKVSEASHKSSPSLKKENPIPYQTLKNILNKAISTTVTNEDFESQLNYKNFKRLAREIKSDEPLEKQRKIDLVNGLFLCMIKKLQSFISGRCQKVSDFFNVAREYEALTHTQKRASLEIKNGLNPTIPWQQRLIDEINAKLESQDSNT